MEHLLNKSQSLYHLVFLFKLIFLRVHLGAFVQDCCISRLSNVLSSGFKSKNLNEMGQDIEEFALIKGKIGTELFHCFFLAFT